MQEILQTMHMANNYDTKPINSLYKATCISANKSQSANCTAYTMWSTNELAWHIFTQNIFLDSGSTHLHDAVF